MRAQTQLLIGLTSRTHYQPGEPRQHHQAILDAIKAADLPGAEAILLHHIEDAQRRACLALGRVRSIENGFTPDPEHNRMEETHA